MIPLGFGSLPPEINSGLLYDGPGVGPMLTAAYSWEQLANELEHAASSYEMVVNSLLTGGWNGPSALQFSQAMHPYLGWLRQTSLCAQQTATKLLNLVSSYEAAHSAIVPPEAVAANRAELLRLVQTNTLGQNTGAIAANWDQYYAMWVKDAIVMDAYGHSAQSSIPTTGFSAPPPVSHDGGLAQSPSAISPLASAGSTPGSSSGISSLGSIPSPGKVISAIQPAVKNIADFTGVTNLQNGIGYAILGPRLGNYLVGLGNSAASISARLAGAASKAAASAAASAAGPSLLPDLSALAHLGQAGTVGGLSIPPSWIGAAPLEGIPGAGLVSSLSSTLGHGSGVASALSAQELLQGAPALVNTATRSAAPASSMMLPRLELATHVIPLTPAAG